MIAAPLRAARLIGSLALALHVAPVAAQTTTPDTLRVRAPGLRAPVEIVTDRWGVPHIFAENEHDLFFAQGYNAARDRLFQFEIWRRGATGTVAEILGPDEVERDIGARLFRFRGDLSAELNHYHPRGEAIVGAFVAGVNAYIAETERDPSLLTPEFRLLGIRPGRWTPEVVVSRHQGLLGNIGAELANGRAVAKLGPERVLALSDWGPGTPDVALDPAIDGELLSADILRLYNAFRRGIRFEPEDIAAELRGDAADAADAASSAVSASSAVNDGVLARANAEADALHAWRERRSIGSNNWVVSGRLTASGHPMMANDPHRTLAVPSLRYWAHLVAPGWNVIGGGEPVLPGISIGHNEHGAWGLTVFATDSEDLYVYETHPADPRQYRYRGGWEAMRVIRDTIPVEGRGPVVVDLKYTRHGPVVHEDTANDVAYAVRAGWLEVGGAPYLASLRMDQARSWAEFREACSYSHIPGENMLWAGRDGTIGWQAVGISPIRRTWSGLVPVPGDGRYEWDGYLPIPELPHAVNPPEGFIATANNELIPEGYAHRDAVGWDWSDPYRWQRIVEVLGSGRRDFTLDDMLALQMDYLSIPARTLVPLLAPLRADDTATEAARRRLLQWDFRLEPLSVAAGIYVAWEDRLEASIERLAIPPEARDVLHGLSMRQVLARVQEPGLLFDGEAAARDALLLTSLREAVAELTEELGPEMEAWRYGQPDYKHVRFEHALSELVGPELRARLNVGTLPRGGYGYTVNMTGGADNQSSGATFRIVTTTEDWDRARGTNAPGQSGDPASPHYRDLFAPWARDEYFPAYYTRERIDAVADAVTILLPVR